MNEEGRSSLGEVGCQWRLNSVRTKPSGVLPKSRDEFSFFHADILQRPICARIVDGKGRTAAFEA
jgi:hypothetical protein